MSWTRREVREGERGGEREPKEGVAKRQPQGDRQREQSPARSTHASSGPARKVLVAEGRWTDAILRGRKVGE